jgi:hypothetical protein
MRFGKPGRRAIAFAAVTIACLGTGCAGASGNGAALSPKSGVDAAETHASERALATGHVVTEPFDFERGDSHYVGGVSSGLVPAPPDQVLAAVLDAHSLAAMLPKTKRVSLVEASGDKRRIELLQGNSFVSATYTVEIAATDTPGEVRFHLDRSRRHDIDDVYGYFKVRRYDDRRSLVTVAAAVDIGSSFTTMLFGKHVQQVILSTPNVMRAYFARMEASGAVGLVAQNDR